MERIQHASTLPIVLPFGLATAMHRQTIPINGSLLPTIERADFLRQEAAGLAPADPGAEAEGAEQPQQQKQKQEQRQRLDVWLEAYPPAHPAEFACVEQAVAAQGEIARLRSLLATLRAETARKAENDWLRDREDRVAGFISHFNVSCYEALVNLRRSAAGVRYLIERWEELEANLHEWGTWHGTDRLEAIQLLGLSARLDDLYLSETAYRLWVDCLAAQEHPDPADIAVVCRRNVVPKSLRERGETLWAPDPEASRARLHALVERQLPELRALEEQLRVDEEVPERAAARALALTRLVRHEEPLLKALRSHEGAFLKAMRGVGKGRRAG